MNVYVLPDISKTCGFSGKVRCYLLSHVCVTDDAKWVKGFD